MPEFALPDAGEFVDLDNGYTLSADAVSGHVISTSAQSALSRALQPDEFDAQLAAAGLVHEKDIVLVPDAVQARALGEAPPSVTLEVAHAPGTRTLLLVQDESGALRWQLPEIGARDLIAPELSVVSRFVVPLEPGASGARGFPLGKKILKTFVYPVTDLVLGPIAAGFARRWETRNRPYLVRSFRHDDYTRESAVLELTTEAWREMAQGPALLWVHGTFSSAAAFASIPVDVMRELGAAYGNRSFAFNHFTLSDDPAQNARVLLERIPAGLQLDVDIVCHSRGGLVARELARLGMAGAGSGRLRVRRIVFVGVPNAGTALADDDHMVEMIDRFTTIAKYFPSPTVQKILEGAVLTLKVIGHALLHDLPGLRAMNPRGPYLATLNAAGSTPPEYFGIAADFEPRVGEPLFSLTRLEDGAADRVFTDSANDLVVPRDGVAASNGAMGFPIPSSRQLIFDASQGVIHTHFFQYAATYEHIRSWLTSDGARDMRARATPRELSPGELAALRPHVVNLSEGKFRQSGKYYTTPQDVDAIFQQHLPAWRQQLPQGEPLRVVFFAHGGLVGEQDGLAIAQKHVAWWKRNGVYPIYFVWETGLFDAVRSILQSVGAKARDLGARDIWDHTTDPLVEAGCRALGGVKVWGAMKANARLASEQDGGARYVAQRLKELCDGLNHQGVGFELHAVGHSAGSIFHSYFLPTAASLGVPHFRTLQLLAPAIRVDEFNERLLPAVGNVAGQLTMYSMLRDFEEADNCIGVYHKSLLCLIRGALEAQHKAPIVGLEQSARSDDNLRRLFGLDGSPNPAAHVVWSVTSASTGDSASQSRSHGGFDDDAATMSSVAARVLGLPSARVPYTGTGAREFGDWPISTEWLEGFDIAEVGVSLRPEPAPTPQPVPEALRPAPVPAPAKPNGKTPPSPTSQDVPTKGGSSPSRPRLEALCVGIDDYPAPNALSGCVNDADAWSGALRSYGFVVNPLKNATYKEITDALRALVSGSKPGDTLVFQYSGHGCELPDKNGDENGDPDQALVPVDFGSGAFLVDDDVNEILGALPAGVRLTVFTDCCHSATNTRAAFGWNQPAPPAGTKARVLVPTADQIRAHLRFRASQRALRMGRDVSERNVMRWAAFAACQRWEKAYEANGHGAYTGHAVGLLSRGIEGVSNAEFQRRILDAFGSAPAQRPYLDCPPEFMDDAVLGGVPAGRSLTVTPPVMSPWSATRPLSHTR